MPAAVGWIQYLSLFRYSYEALVVNDLTGVQIADTISGATVNVSICEAAPCGAILLIDTNGRVVFF
jgi:hypothetical protein